MFVPIEESTHILLLEVAPIFVGVNLSSSISRASSCSTIEDIYHKPIEGIRIPHLAWMIGRVAKSGREVRLRGEIAKVKDIPK